MPVISTKTTRYRAHALVATLALALSASAGAVSPNWWVDITNDRTEKVKAELAMGEDPNVKNPEGQPAIMQAIQDQAWGVYDLLVAHRALDVNITNKNNETPLMYLAIVGDVKRARALISKGAQVNRLDWTPLHYAASKGELEMVKFLIANKAIVDAPSPDGTTPLMMAAFSGSDVVVKALLDAGAEVTTQNLSKLDASDWARNKGFTSLADRLQKLIQATLAQRHAGTNQTPAGLPGSVGTSSRPAVATPTPAPKPILAEEHAPTSDTGGTPSTSLFDPDRVDREGQ